MILRKILKFVKKNLWFGKKRRRQNVKSPVRKKKRTGVRKSPLRKKKVRSKPLPAAGERARKSKELLIGVVTHYFPKVRAAVLHLKKRVQIGMPIHIKGNKTDFRQTIGSMQINRIPVASASKGDEIGLEVFRDVSPGDRVYLST